MVKEAKHRSWGITSRGSHLCDEKRAPGGLGIILPSYVWIIVSHYKDPYLNKQYFMECHKFFFFRLADCRGDFWRSVRVKHWYSEWILKVSIAAGWFVRLFFFKISEKKTSGMEKGTVFDPATLPELHVNMHTTQDGLDFRSLQGNVSQLLARPHNSVV